MARPIRVEFEGAIYHVTARGAERKAVFRSDRDRTLFLETLQEMLQRFGVVLRLYCLMPNHYHLVLETPRANLSRAVGWLQTTYTIRFNARHRRSGHLFQGRFKALLVEEEIYAVELVKYVHLNPVRPARKSAPIDLEKWESLQNYEWSSHRDYAGLRKQSLPVLSLGWLSHWGSAKGEGRKRYVKDLKRSFTQGTPDLWAEVKGGLALVSDELWERIHEKVGSKKGQKELQWHQRRNEEARRERLAKALAKEKDERVKLWVRARLGGERMVDLAREKDYRDGGTVLQVVKRLEQRAQRDKDLKIKMVAYDKMSGVES